MDRLLQVRIPAELHQRLKVQAAKEDRSMRELVQEAVEKLLAEREAREKGGH